MLSEFCGVNLNDVFLFLCGIILLIFPFRSKLSYILIARLSYLIFRSCSA
jgi:hypothetical protein